MSEPFSSADRRFMARALRLAERGLYTTDPNPRVGCVLTRDDDVVAEGWHRRAGEPHAERLALEQAGSRASGCTVYVTLEPCAHRGRTGPCAEALVAAGVSRVVAAMADPNPQVNGGGMASLQAAGIRSETGLMEAEARRLNPGFVARWERNRPWVRLKMAGSLDGRSAMASGESQWITGPEARQDVQRWRARSSAILTGIGTVLADDPRLSVRLEDAKRQPLRVVVDTRGRTPASARLLDGTAPVLLATGGGTPVPAGAEVFACPAGGGVDLGALMAELARREVNEVWVEAGPTLGGALLQAGLVDELLVYVAPRLLGSAARPLLDLPGLERLDQAPGLRWIETRRVGEDLRLRLVPGDD